MPQPPLHPVPDHRSTDIAAHDEPNSGGCPQAVARRRLRTDNACRWARVRWIGVHDQPGAASSPAPPYCQFEVGAAGQSGRRRQHAMCLSQRLLDQPDQADRLLRPLRRRAARIARPARVRIRSRNPCVLARLRLLGWKVRFPLLTSGPTPGLTSCSRAASGPGAGVWRQHVPTPDTEDLSTRVLQPHPDSSKWRHAGTFRCLPSPKCCARRPPC